ncbi:ATP-binding protein [Ruminiclostridium herbifermentans]|uniref:ATP-binding protein n=1 Tax=Ruminiclostridium herbifermentans TaxID=2488810 RepID=A0A4V6EQL5_9FIRM|nr:ATP-binding protein [Ruminiclostridium herbifermentans]QNU65814.1 ATP-binding protein [Ruminiclostridium herbifermentans]
MLDMYMSSLEHLADEFKRMDLLLKLYMLSEAQNESTNHNSYISDAMTIDEVYSLLFGNGDEQYDKYLIEAELAMLNKVISQKLEASLNNGIHLSVPYISKLFGLSSFEINCIILCLLPEVNRKYEKIFGYFQDDITVKSPSIDLVLKLFTKTESEKIYARCVFDQQAPLVKYLMELQGDISDRRIPMIARHLKLDEWVVNYLLDAQVLDARLANVAEMILPEDIRKDNENTHLEKNIVSFIEYYRKNKEKGSKQIFYFNGPNGAGKMAHAKAVSCSMGMPLIIADLEKMVFSEIYYDELLRLLGRQLMIGNTALCINNFDIVMTEDGRYKEKITSLLQMIEKYVPITFILGKTEWNPSILNENVVFMGVDFPYPKASQRKEYWEKFSQEYLLDESVNIEDFSGNFRFTPGQIKRVLRLGESNSVWNGKNNGQIAIEDLNNACYTQSNRKLNHLSVKMKKTYSWDMLVLPPDQMSQMKEICNQVKFRSLVYEKWGFDKRLALGKGLNVLFSGPPGSGKTMAAEVIANEIGLEIYKIDVSQIVSKYIGETEKNLSEIFAEAETSNAILFFDEADALFGKRSEVKDAHDRYANVEISYLLQKMEEYTGIVILATNLNQNIDDAFLRRLHFNIVFPFPEKEQRKLIWKGMFPSGAPVDNELDYDFLAEKFIMAGGNIKNIAINAAFFAAKEECPIGIKHIMLAAKREYKKMGKTFVKSDFDPYYKLIEVTD